MVQYVRFNYLYRDAGNYKSWGELVFPNPENLDIKEIDAQLRKCFEREAFFIADQVDVPNVFIFATENLNSDDHCYHEYAEVESIVSLESEVENRTIKEFLNQVRMASEHGWIAFNLLDRIEQIRSNAS